MIDLDMKQFGSGGFNDPLRHAMGLRSAQDAKKMRMWDSCPSLFQNTIFHAEQDARIKELRLNGTLEEKLAEATRLKEQGNGLLKRGNMEKAVESYEKGAGILRYVHCIRPDWKNDDGSYKGIEDEWLVVSEFDIMDDTTAALEWASDARNLVTSLYLNIALAFQKQGNFGDMKKACDEVLTDGIGRHAVDPQSAKAYFRRAQARVGPMTSKDEDRDAAIQDLTQAAKLAPQDKAVRELLQGLKTEKKEQKKADKERYSGFFDKGQIVDDDRDAEGRDVRDAPMKMDLRDPKVQAFLDVHPGPAQYENRSPRGAWKQQTGETETMELDVDDEDREMLRQAGFKTQGEKEQVVMRRKAAEQKVLSLKRQLEKAEQELRNVEEDERSYGGC